jgi:hypothetical protein
MSTTRARSRVTVSDSARQIHAESPSSVETVPTPLNILAEAAATVDALPQRTRSGRVSKPPERYVPIEQVEDDYEPEDYDTDESDDDSDIDTESEDEDEDESDADDDGNLAGFVVPDKSESDEDDNGEPPLPKATKRAPVKKRPTTRK